MIENSRPEEEKIIKDIRNLFRLKKEQNYNAIKDIRNLFRREKETKVIKDRILRDTKNLFEHEEEDNYYKPVRVSNNYIEYKSNGDRNKNLSVEEYLNKIRPYLKDIINNLKKSDTWKIQLAIANNFIFSIDNDDEILEEHFDSLKNRFQNNLESMKDSDFFFYYVHFMSYKCHKISDKKQKSINKSHQ